MTTVTQPQFAELLDDPETLPELLLLDEPDVEETLSEEDWQMEAGARANVRKNSDRFGLPPLLECPIAKNPIVFFVRVKVHDPSEGPHCSPGAGSLTLESILT